MVWFVPARFCLSSVFQIFLLYSRESQLFVLCTYTSLSASRHKEMETPLTGVLPIAALRVVRRRVVLVGAINQSPSSLSSVRTIPTRRCGGRTSRLALLVCGVTGVTQLLCSVHICNGTLFSSCLVSRYIMFVRVDGFSSTPEWCCWCWCCCLHYSYYRSPSVPSPMCMHDLEHFVNTSTDGQTGLPKLQPVTSRQVSSPLSPCSLSASA